MPDWLEGTLVPMLAVVFVTDKVVGILRNRGIDLNSWGKVLNRLDRIRWEEWRREDKNTFESIQKEDDRGKLVYNRWIAELFERQEKQGEECNRLLLKISDNQIELISAFRNFENQLK